MNEQLVATVEAALARAGVLHAGATLLVALSGGADSVALLYAVCDLRVCRGLTVRAAHVEHGLRGDDSLADAAFCQALCDGLGVPFTCDHAALGGGMAAPGAEARARQARYGLLLQRAKAANAAALLLAHHRDDQAETVLARLIRGSGARGLAGMREVVARDGVCIVRPLLAVPKAAILAALGTMPYRTDESNQQPCCQRNRLRAEVLPLLAAENPRASEHIAQSAALLALDEDCLQTQADALLAGHLLDKPPLLCVPRAPLAAAPKAVAARALRAWAELGFGYMARETAGDGEHSLAAADTLALLALLAAPAGQMLNLPRGLCALSGARHLHLVRMADGAPVRPAPQPAAVWLGSMPALQPRGSARPDAPFGDAPGAAGDRPAPVARTVCLGATAFALRPFDPARDTVPDGIRSVAVPTEALPRLTLRMPTGGERIAPFGAGGGKPLRRYLIDRKLDAPFRPVLPLLCEGDAVWWAAGIGAAEPTRLGGAPATLIAVSGTLPWAQAPMANAPHPDKPATKE